MPRIANNVPMSRLNLELPEATRDRLEHLRDATNAASMTEVIRTALAVYDLLFNETQRGSEIVFRPRNGKGPDRHIILVK